MMIAVDVSGSMAAEDFKPDNRLAVAKSTIKTFVSKRNSDRIGLVIFGGDAYTQCPQTLDYDVLLELLHAVQLNDAGQGTAIGMAISTALNRIKNSVSESKVIILLTDGENNRGVISPTHAASLAKDLGVKIYTIGIGKQGGAPIPYIHPVYGKIYSNERTYLDENTLKEIASITNGKYYRAVDPSTLNKILSEINELETSKIKSIEYASYTELFPIFIGLSIFILFIEIILSNLFIIKIP
jgi:Ca-activated chloride channel family protein